MSNRLIESDRSVSVAYNSDSLADFREVVAATSDVPGIDSYTIGGAIGVRGLSAAQRIIEHYDPTKIIIYDHQKAGTSDASLAAPILRAVADSGADAAVLFPIQDLQGQGRWIEAAQAQHLEVIVGPEVVPLPSPLCQGHDQTPGKGFVRMFIRQAIRNGVENIWLRGDPRRVHYYQELLHEEGGDNCTLFLARSADASTGQLTTRVPTGNPAVAVIGGAICKANDIRSAAIKLSQQFVSTAGVKQR